MTARFQVVLVEADDFIGMNEVPRFRQFSGLQPFRLQDRTRAAVKEEPFFAEAIK